MAIDTTPSTVATNALQAIPFASLIGGPLDASIKAQANAAKTSWEFIREVGLTVDPDTGEKKAVNVTFQYNNNGQMTTLVVPLLVIVPIPYLAINNVSIDFLANISASSSSVTETSSDTELGVDASAEAKFEYAGFSAGMEVKANYSSKQHSKSAQDSRYSVEYTMAVHVDGGQADMPAGLGTILNILQGSISSVSPEDSLKTSTDHINIRKEKRATLQVTVKDSHGVLAPAVKVAIEVVPRTGASPFNEPTPNVKLQLEHYLIKAILGEGGDESPRGRTLPPRMVLPYLRRYHSSMPTEKTVMTAMLEAHQVDEGRLLTRSGQQRQFLSPHINTSLNARRDELETMILGDGESPSSVTNSQGTVIFNLELTDAAFEGMEILQGEIQVTADIPVKAGEVGGQVKRDVKTVSYMIIPNGPPVIAPGKLEPSAPSVEFVKKGQEQTITITLTKNNKPVPSTTVKAQVAKSGTDPVSTYFSNIKVGNTDSGNAADAQGTTDKDGKITFTFTTLSSIAEKTSVNLKVIFSSGDVECESKLAVDILAPPIELTADPTELTFSDKSDKTVVITLKKNGTALVNTEVKAQLALTGGSTAATLFDVIGATPAGSGILTAENAIGKTDATNGKITFTFKAKQNASPALGTLTFTANDSNSAEVPVNVQLIQAGNDSEPRNALVLGPEDESV